jgi:hypothetical protein
MENPNIDDNIVNYLLQLILQNTIQTNSIFDSFSTPPKKINNIRIEEGKRIPVNKYKKRLFSDIEYGAIINGMSNVTKAIHHIKLKNVYANNNRLIIESSNFRNFHQKMIYNYYEKTIEFSLIQPNNTHLEYNELEPDFYYKSKYKIIFDPVTKKKKIVLDPYTTKKIIKPIIYEEFINIKLNSTKNGPVNVFKYIIDNSDKKNKEEIRDIIINLSHEVNYNKNEILFNEFNHYLNIINRKKKEEGIDMRYSDIYNNVRSHLQNINSLIKHINQLKKWKKLYNTLYNDTKNIYDIEYKCVYEKKYPNKNKNNNNEYKGYYSKENVKLLSLVKKYFDHDKQLELEDDTIQIKVRDQTVFDVGSKDPKLTSKDPKQECKDPIKRNIKPKISKESTDLKELSEIKIKDKNASYFIKNVDKFIWIDHPIKTSKNIGDFGIYTPYLVSYILRHPQSIKLNINGDNIIDFCNFIHGFKSAGLSLVSLMLQLVDSYSNYIDKYNENNKRIIKYKNTLDHVKEENNKIRIFKKDIEQRKRTDNNKIPIPQLNKCGRKKQLEEPKKPNLIKVFTKIIIKFPYKKIYSLSIQYPTYIDHNIIFDLSKLYSNNNLNLFKLNLSILQNKIEPDDNQDILYLKFIELDEPYYGISENSNIDDFDELFININTGNYINANLVDNIKKFNKKMKYVDSEPDKKEQEQLPVPNLNNFFDFPSLSSIKPQTIKQESIKPQTIKQESIKPQTIKQESIRPLFFDKYDVDDDVGIDDVDIDDVDVDIDDVDDDYDYNDGKFQSSSSSSKKYKQKYLKYKLKYMKLKNL